MSYKIDPELYCQSEGCHRPKETGESFCTPCLRLARAVAVHLDAAPSREEVLAGLDFTPSDAAFPRCVVSLSKDGNHLALTMMRGPGFTEQDVDAVVALMKQRHP